MSDTDNYLKILEKISEIREDSGVLKNEMGHLKEDVSGMKKELEHIKDQDIHQNALLDKHILGVQTAQGRLENEIEARKADKALMQKQIEEIDHRLKKAEFVPTFFSSLRKIFKWVGGFAVAGAAIAEFLHLLKVF